MRSAKEIILIVSFLQNKTRCFRHFHQNPKGTPLASLGGYLAPGFANPEGDFVLALLRGKRFCFTQRVRSLPPSLRGNFATKSSQRPSFVCFAIFAWQLCYEGWEWWVSEATFLRKKNIVLKQPKVPLAGAICLQTICPR